MSLTSRKTYTQLYEEREAVFDEADAYKQRTVYQKRMGLWKNSDYLSELLYIRMRIETEMIPHYIVETMKLHKRLLILLPMEIVIHIASFGTIEDQTAIQMVVEGKESTIDVVDPL
jgi:hypothetical protein